MSTQNFDEVDFSDEGSGSAFMHLGKAQGGLVSIRLTVGDVGDLDLVVSVADAHRLGQRLTAVADEIASDR
jgi:hypothetical protein